MSETSSSRGRWRWTTDTAEYEAAEIVWTRDLSSGRLHERYRIRGRLVSDERCNLERAQAGAYREIDRVELVRLFSADPALACQWCWPPRTDSEDA